MSNFAKEAENVDSDDVDVEIRLKSFLKDVVKIVIPKVKTLFGRY